MLLSQVPSGSTLLMMGISAPKPDIELVLFIVTHSFGSVRDYCTGQTVTGLDIMAHTYRMRIASIPRA